MLALLGGFGIFFLRNFAQVLGENGQIPIILAAWSPPVAAVLLSLGLLAASGGWLMRRLLALLPCCS